MACNCNSNTNSTSYLQVVAPCPSCNCTCTSPTQTCQYCVSSGTCSTCGTDTIDSSKINYSGATLTCIDKPSGTSVEEIIQAMDTAICQATGADYSTYDFSCLLNPDSSQITTQQQFVEVISDRVCTADTTYDTFVTNYNTFVTNITNLVTTSHIPGITGACIGIVDTDTNAQAFTKTNTAICAIQTAINPSSANWSDCGFTVGSAPTTIIGGFNKVLSYLCTVKGLIPPTVTLPTFNNVGSCLPGTLTTTDTLVSTVGKLKTLLCTLNYDLSAINFGCVDGATILQDVIQNVINRVNDYSIYAFDPTYFTVTNINDTFPCQGLNVTINPSGLDKKVASNGSDVSPGYLSDKLQAGTSVTLDYTTVPGKVIIASTALGDHKVKVNSSDASADYLDAKIDGVADATGALTLDATSNGGNSKVVITPVFDMTILSQEILNTISADTALFSFLKTLVCSMDCSGGATVQFVIESPGKMFQFSGDQNSPTLGWYNTGATTVTGIISSGTYPITTVATNPQMSIAFQNNDAGSVTLGVVVKDLSNVTVPSSSSISTTVVAGAPYTNAAFNLGVGVSAYVVHVSVT